MYHEEEGFYERRENASRRHPHHEAEQQNAGSRWHQPRPFMNDRERHHQEEEIRRRSRHEGGQYRPQQEYRDEINWHQHGFSDDHRGPDSRNERREWRDENERHNYSPDNQHARDRWQQPEQLPPLRERHRHHQSRRDENWDERRW